MVIKVNGRDLEVNDTSTIQDVVAVSGFKDSLIVVTLNGAVTLRESWARPLNPGDSLEIVRVIGGG